MGMTMNGFKWSWGNKMLEFTKDVVILAVFLNKRVINLINLAENKFVFVRKKERLLRLV